MSRCDSLETMSKKVNIVVRKGIEIPIDTIKQYCDTYFETYAFIEHKNDIDSVTGGKIPVHYHIVGDYLNNKVRFSTRLNEICKWFNFDNNCGINIERYRSFTASIQYLIHKNNPEKTLHDIKDIVTNLTREELDIYITSDSDNVITFDLLYAVIYKANNLVDVMREIGIGNYRTYRNTIKDMWEVVHPYGKTDKIRVD